MTKGLRNADSGIICSVRVDWHRTIMCRLFMKNGQCQWCVERGGVPAGAKAAKPTYSGTADSFTRCCSDTFCIM